jgi:putative hydrolase of the HAD superfamily
MSARGGYDAVIFDLFGTLVENFHLADYRALLHAMADLLGGPRVAFDEAWRGSFGARVAGEFRSVEENIRYLYPDLPEGARVDEAVRIRHRFTRDTLVPMHDAVSTLEALRAAGFRLALVSDCSVEVPACWDETPFAPLFDAAIFSCDVRVRKPDPRIYHMACERIGIRPERCLYVGDGGSHELSGAAAVGMHPVLIRRPDFEEWKMLRVDGEAWEGRAIGTLGEVLGLVGEEQRGR